MSLVDIDAYQCRSTTPEVVLIATIMHGPDSAAEWAVTDDGHESPSSPTFVAGGTRHAKEEEGGRSDGGTRVFQDLYDDAVSRMKRRQQREIDRELQEASEMEQKIREHSQKLRSQQQKYLRRPHAQGVIAEGLDAHLSREAGFLEKKERKKQQQAAWKQRREIFEEMAECTFSPVLYTKRRQRVGAAARSERIAAQRQSLEDPPEGPPTMWTTAYLKAEARLVKNDKVTQCQLSGVQTPPLSPRDLLNMSNSWQLNSTVAEQANDCLATSSNKPASPPKNISPLKQRCISPGKAVEASEGLAASDHQPASPRTNSPLRQHRSGYSKVAEASTGSLHTNSSPLRRRCRDSDNAAEVMQASPRANNSPLRQRGSNACSAGEAPGSSPITSYREARVLCDINAGNARSFSPISKMDPVVAAVRKPLMNPDVGHGPSLYSSLPSFLSSSAPAAATLSPSPSSSSCALTPAVGGMTPMAAVKANAGPIGVLAAPSYNSCEGVTIGSTSASGALWSKPGVVACVRPPSNGTQSQVQAGSYVPPAGSYVPPPPQLPQPSQSPGWVSPKNQHRAVQYATLPTMPSSVPTTATQTPATPAPIPIAAVTANEPWGSGSPRMHGNASAPPKLAKTPLADRTNAVVLPAGAGKVGYSLSKIPTPAPGPCLMQSW